MIPAEYRLLLRSSLIGIGLTLAVVLADKVGLLNPLDRWFYDRRASACQYFAPPPTDKLVHLDVDAPTLEAMGRWPWTHSTVAKIIDELNLAGAKVVALDTNFLNPQEVEDAAKPEPIGDETPTAASIRRPDIPMKDDEVLAESMRHMGSVLVPFTFEPLKPPSQRGMATLAALTDDLELTPEEVEIQLQAQHLAIPLDGLAGERDRFIVARKQAMFDRVLTQLSHQPRGVDNLRRLLLPRSDPTLSDSPLMRLLRSEDNRVLALLALRRYGRAIPQGLPPVLPVELSQMPPSLLARAAGTTGFAYYVPDSDGVVRSIPLFAEHRGYLFPQLALSVACRMLDTTPAAVRLEADRIVIPHPGERDVDIPVHQHYIREFNENVGFFFDIPWVGTSEWELMYDPNHQVSLHHIPVAKVWEIHELLERIVVNNHSVDDMLDFVLEYLVDPRADEFHRHHPPIEETAPRLVLLDSVRKKVEEQGFVESFKGVSDEDLARAERQADESVAVLNDKLHGVSTPTARQRSDLDEVLRRQNQAHAEHKMFVCVGAMRTLSEQTRKLKTELDKQRVWLSNEVNGRAVIIGWVATAAADFVPTSLHGKCPGPVVQGAIFNAIMTGYFKRRAAPWLTILITVLLGLLTTAAVAWFSPIGASVTAAFLSVGYLVVNGIVLFDYEHIIVGVAGPLTCVVVVWSGATVGHFVSEIAERRRITRRFQNYVDPALVRYVINHPDQVKFEGQVREMTVVFADLADFTKISELLKEKAVGVLNDYFSLMMPIIKANKGFINKLQGDGIMFYFGAPEENPHHALHAVSTAIRMKAALPDINQRFKRVGLPSLKMRIGVSSGPMIVGDAGGGGRSDYTVLGDTVNLGSRLETANKFTGTRILINDRTAELVGQTFLLRPVGRLRVIGKAVGVMTFEPLCLSSDASEPLKELATMSRAVVELFHAAQFESCLQAIVRMETRFGRHELTSLYATLCREYLQTPPGGGFQGLIVLTEK